VHANTSDLHFPWKKTPDPGEITEVAPGLLWLRLPLPYALNHINVYLVEDGKGWAVVDTGINDDTTREYWQTTMNTGLGGRPITRVIVSHFHPDHVGLAGWLTGRFSAPLYMNQTEYFVALSRQTDTNPERISAYCQFYRRGGLSEEQATDIVRIGQRYPNVTTPVPAAYEGLRHGETLLIGRRKFKIITGGGHAFEQVMLYCQDENIFFAADQVLATISPNITVWPVEPRADSLGLFLQSLDGLAKTISHDTLVLAGHNLPFRGLQSRVSGLKEHHRQRCAEIAAACAGDPKTVADLMPLVFHRALDGHQMSFAFGELVAHLNYLVRQGTLQCDVDSTSLRRFSLNQQASKNVPKHQTAI
jgi:glyoxylase-like metal-dependent hydrolase (beta-lactamase superfamily II)